VGILLLLVAGTVSGYLAQLLKLPGGAALGAMLGAAAMNIALGERAPTLPNSLAFAALVLVGVSVGATINRDSLQSAAGYLVPALLIVVSLSVVGVVLALVLQRYFGFDLITALFAAAPGGMGNMAILAKDAGGNGFAVVLIHLIRLVGIFIFVPVVAFFLRR
jgi:membrane AbrB-like protein